MQVITVQLADNGVIKSVEEDNANAAGEGYSSVVVYDFESDNASENKIKFLYEISEDCGLEFGSTKDSDQIKIIKDVAAGAVLFISICAAVIGLYIILPKFLDNI